MSKVLVTAQVHDGTHWEKSFRTHTDIFKSYRLQAPIEYSVSGNEAAVCVDTSDVKALLESLNQQATIDAMKADGVKRETVKVYVLDKDLRV